MDAVLGEQIEWMLALQQHQGPLLDSFFALLTKFGGSYYVFMVPVLLWCVDYRTGLRAMQLLAITLFFNTALKEWIGQPRPFAMDPRIVSSGEDGYGLPSGHAQLVVVFWGAIAIWVATPWFWGVAVALMGLMGFSRVYLGVHFPTDVIAGFALGAFTLWAYVRWYEPIEAKLAALPREALVWLGVALALALFDVSFVDDEHHLALGSAGFLGGVGIGMALAQRRLDFDGRGVWWKRMLRYGVGFVMTLGLINAMQKLGTPGGIGTTIVVFIDLGIFGAWLTFAMPWLFCRVGLGSARTA